MKYALLNSIVGRAAGSIIDTTQGDSIDAIQGVGGVLIPLPNATAEEASTKATRSIMRGEGEAFAPGMMMAPILNNKQEIRRFIFQNGATRSGALYGDWAEMFADIAKLQQGEQPEIVFLPTGGSPFVVPTTGMPSTGWNVKLGSFRTLLLATGIVHIQVPQGAAIDMLSLVGDGVLLEFQPTTNYGPLRWSEFAGTGSPQIIQVGLGAKFCNTGSQAAIQTPGDGTTNVFVLNGATQDPSTVPPASTAPYINVNGNDGLVCVCNDINGLGSFEPNWASGGAAAPVFVATLAGAAKEFTIPNWLGPAPTYFRGGAASNVNYTPSTPADWNGNPPTTQQALDRIAAAVATLLGGPIPLLTINNRVI